VIATSLVPAGWSWPTRVLAAALVAAGLLAVGWLHGARHVQDSWDAVSQQQNERVATVRTRQADATAQVVTQYVDRLRTVRVAGETLVKEVPVYVPLDTPALPGGWRVLHDAAARAKLPDPAASADAAPVPAQDAAATVAGNYLTCHEQSEQLTALQDWVTRQIEAAR
jgi:hypothetical protein